MNNILLASFSSVVFLIIHYVHKKIVKKEKIDPKDTFQQGIIVFLSTVGGLFLFEQFESSGIKGAIPSISGGQGGVGPKVFTDTPGF
tara:strand:- start:3057 stop:3317 length:261 start_codon:yes stop_codon:yes gene_type:complete